MSSNRSKKPTIDTKMKERSRDHRKHASSPEKILWNIVRNRQINGLKFRRQHVIGNYIVDFYCDEAKLVVELDGDSHYRQFEYDQKRDQYLRDRGMKVIRIANEDLFKHPDGVWEFIAREAGTPTTFEPPSPRPSPGGRGSKE